MMIKSPGVRRQFLKKLRRNILLALREDTESSHLSGGWDHLFLDVPDGEAEKTSEILQKIPGIHHFYQMKEFPLGSFEENLEHCLAEYTSILEGKTFVVRCKRTGNHDFTSPEIERYLGGGLLAKTDAKKVDLHTPEVTVRMEIREDKLFLLREKIWGQNGFPVGTQGRVLLLISGGFDSSVVAHIMMKKGCEVDYLFFNLGGVAHERGVKQVTYKLWNDFGAGYKSRFFVVNFETMVPEILKKTEKKYWGVILKRLMMRAGNMVAQKHLGLITGESLAQVSSQTLENLAVINDSSVLPIYRPLFGLEKREIIQRAEDIGVARYAEAMPEYCAVISDRPTTCAKLEIVKEEEEKMDEDTFLQTLEACQCSKVGDEDFLPEAIPVEETSEVAEEEQIIDIREEEEIAEIPLPFEDILTISFLDLEKRFGQLDKKKTYLLYCERGVVSRGLAENLIKQGLLNVKLFVWKG